MIDLHMHTTYSDGTDSLEELLKKVNDVNLEIISITDHNSCRAYDEMQSINVSDIYKGEIIAGTEITTTFDNRVIEVLAYGFDYKKLGYHLNCFYDPNLVLERTQILYERLIKKLDELGFEYDISYKTKVVENELFERMIYNELRKYPKNMNILNEDIFASFSHFFRKGLTNPNSKLYLGYPEFKMPLQNVIELVHETGGKVFLAHPYQYRFNDTEEFLERLYDEYELDGIECYYTTFSKKQTEYLLSFAKRRNLLVSGGSDYHGTNKKLHELGIGNGSLKINKDIIDNWQIKYIVGQINK